MEVSPVATAVHVLSKSLGETATSIGANQLQTNLTAERVPEAVQALVDAGVKIYAVTPEKATLEDYFLDITGTGDKASPDNLVSREAVAV